MYAEMLDIDDVIKHYLLMPGETRVGNPNNTKTCPIMRYFKTLPFEQPVGFYLDSTNICYLADNKVKCEPLPQWVIDMVHDLDSDDNNDDDLYQVTAYEVATYLSEWKLGSDYKEDDWSDDDYDSYSYDGEGVGYGADIDFY